MRKIITLLCVLTMIITGSTGVFAMSESADCACVINGTTGEIIFSKDETERHAMASTTKIMTAVVALERCRMDEVVSISANAANQEGSAAYVEPGMQIYMRDLLYGLMLNSGNDAAVAIAEHIAGSVEAFAGLMNEKVRELELNDTHFVNPSGLDAPEHYTTALDLALVARYAMTIPEFREIVETSKYQAQLVNSDKMLYFKNHNKMLKLYENATGIKTGFTRATGRCLVSSAKRDGMEFIAVTLGDANDWKNHQEMLDYSFSMHYPKKVVEEGMRVKEAKIGGNKYNMVAASDFIVPLKESGGNTVDVISHIAKNLVAPINAGEKVGYLEIRCGGETVGSVDIISESEIRSLGDMRIRNSFSSCLIRVLNKLLI
ncbi:MAG: D-alanyl-D-alanine carboxypeptidase [Oscillospiraceae bacterium]|nr:D-alanyl-D-alanine carboxypeptidase [Oscillospiraceae bacterium]